MSWCKNFQLVWKNNRGIKRECDFLRGYWNCFRIYLTMFNNKLIWKTQFTKLVWYFTFILNTEYAQDSPIVCEIFQKYALHSTLFSLLIVCIRTLWNKYCHKPFVKLLILKSLNIDRLKYLFIVVNFELKLSQIPKLFLNTVCNDILDDFITLKINTCLMELFESFNIMKIN